MRRSSLALLLSFLLVFVQHGALLHELGHLQAAGHGAGAAMRADLQSSSAAFCQSCEAFAQVANPAGGAARAVAVDPPALIRAPDPSYAIATADALSPRSRGPPSV